MKICLTYVLLFLLPIVPSFSKSMKLFCYYDTSSASRAGPSKFTSNDMELALHFCTHVVYSYVTLAPKTLTITALAPEREYELARVIHFKTRYPNVKFLLSLSGATDWQSSLRFLNLLESEQQQRKAFIKMLMTILIKYKFDGLSLDLPLPAEKPQTQHNLYSKIWLNFVNVFKSRSGEDTKVSAHRNQLTALIQQLSMSVKERRGLLTLNVLPNIDQKKYFDIPEITKCLDFVILSAFDFYTPQSSPHEADLMSPTKSDGQLSQRVPLANIKDIYKYWHSQNVPRHKIIVGIAAFGRAWKMTLKSNSDGIPPVLYTDGPAVAGPQTQTPGFLSWPEICEKLARDPQLRRVTDAKNKSGVYAYRPADSMGNFGIWISYEDPATTGAKALYVRNHNLGGVALLDLTLDDVHGACSGEKFPILRAIKFRLTRFKA